MLQIQAALFIIKNRTMKKGKMQLLLSDDELQELARLLYLAQFVVDSSHDVYDRKELMNSLLEKVNNLAFERLEITVGRDVQTSSRNVRFFSFIQNMEEESYSVLQAFGDELYYENISEELADRDFKEKYGHVETEALFFNKSLYESLENLRYFYRTELEENSLSRLRLVV